MSQKTDLITLLNSIDTFYAQNIGLISNALWSEQTSLGLSNSEVVGAIKALAEIKEFTNVKIEAIKASLKNEGQNPE